MYSFGKFLLLDGAGPRYLSIIVHVLSIVVQKSLTGDQAEAGVVQMFPNLNTLKFSAGITRNVVKGTVLGAVAGSVPLLTLLST